MTAPDSRLGTWLRAETRPDPTAVRESWRWWLLAPLLIFAVARVLSTFMLLHLGVDVIPTAGGPTPVIMAPAGPADLLTAWDGNWFRQIVDQGYPTELPRDEWGTVQMNAFAFYPGYPTVVSLVTVFGLSTPWAAVLVSLVFGAAAVVLLYRMARPRLGRYSTILTVTAFCFAPTSLTLGAGYTESMAVFLLLLCLHFIQQDRPGWYLVVAVALSLTRPIMLPMAAVVGVVWIIRWLRRNTTPFPVRSQVVWAGLAIFSALLFLLWPGYVGLVNDQIDAYTTTQQAWNWQSTRWLTWGLTAFTDVDRALIFFGILAVVGTLAWRTPQWTWPVRAWIVLYPLYIMSSTIVSTSITRYMLLLVFPAWPFPAWSAKLGRVGQILTLVGVVVFYSAWNWIWIRDNWIPDMIGHP